MLAHYCGTHRDTCLLKLNNTAISGSPHRTKIDALLLPMCPKVCTSVDLMSPAPGALYGLANGCTIEIGAQRQLSQNLKANMSCKLMDACLRGCPSRKNLTSDAHVDMYAILSFRASRPGTGRRADATCNIACEHSAPICRIIEWCHMTQMRRRFNAHRSWIVSDVYRHYDSCNTRSTARHQNDMI